MEETNTMAKQITNIDRKTCGKLQDEVEAALQSLAKKHGVVIESGSGTYYGSHMTMKLKINTVSKDGLVNTKEAEVYKKYQKRLDLPELRTPFTSGSQKFEISGYAPRARKYPILAEDLATGDTYTFSEDAIRTLVGKNKAA